MLVLFAALAAPAHAGAWTQPQGSAYAKLVGRFLVGDQAFDLDGQHMTVAPYRDANLSLYAEYGFTERATVLVTSTPVGACLYGNASGAYLGPTAGGVRLGIWDGPTRVAVESRLGVAQASDGGDLAARDTSGLGPEGVSFVPSVTTSFLDSEVQLGRGLGRFWAVGTGGVRWHSNPDLGTVVQGFWQVGASLPQGFVVDVHGTAWLPTQPVASVNVMGVGQTAYLGVGAAASWWFTERLGLHVGGEGVFYAVSNAATPTIILGLEGR